MIKCPKCDSEHVSIVTKIENEQTRSYFFEFIFGIFFILTLLGIILLFIMYNNSKTSFNEIFLVKNLIQASENAAFIYFILKIELFLFVVSTLIVILFLLFESMNKNNSVAATADTAQYWSKQSRI